MNRANANDLNTLCKYLYYTMHKKSLSRIKKNIKYRQRLKNRRKTVKIQKQLWLAEPRKCPGAQPKCQCEINCRYCGAKFVYSKFHISEGPMDPNPHEIIRWWADGRDWFPDARFDAAESIYYYDHFPQKPGEFYGWTL